MRRRSRWLLIGALFAGGVSMRELVYSAHDARHPAELLRPYVPMVSMETDRRMSPEDWARRSNFDRSTLGARFGATGLIRCGGTVGTGQLTLRNDVITTAAHVLFSGGQPRASCAFQATGGGAPVAIDTQSIRAGSRSPMSEPATRDWAVARLAHAIPNASPYALAAAGGKPGGVLMVAGGNKSADQM